MQGIRLSTLALSYALVSTALTCGAQQLESRSATPLIKSFRLPYQFEPNKGQFPHAFEFAARQDGYIAGLTRHGLLIQSLRLRSNSLPAVVQIRFMGSRAESISGQGRLPGIVNYLQGDNPNGWRVGIPTYSRVKYSSLYRGVDLVLYGREGVLEYDFIVSPRTSYRSIRLQIRGAPALHLSKDGELVIEMAESAFRMRVPAAYQLDRHSKRRMVPVNYVVEAGNVVRMTVSSYDRDHALIIDPTLAFSTYFQQGVTNTANAVAVDASSNIYVTGFSQENIASQSFSAYVAKLSPSGSTLLYTTFLRGNGTSQPTGIAVDASGNAYVAGYTSARNFPTTAFAFQPTYQNPG